MTLTSAQLVSEALAEWVSHDLPTANDFAREGLPRCDVVHLLTRLSESQVFRDAQFSIALVGFGADEAELAAAAKERGLGPTTTDLHVATDWRNKRGEHPRILAFATGYNPSVHGLSFFARASSSKLAGHLLRWAEGQSGFSATPVHNRLLNALARERYLQGLRSLDAVSRFLERWSQAPASDIDAPRMALPQLGLLPDPRLFESSDMGRRLAENLTARQTLTVLAPGEIRQRRKRAARYSSPARRLALNDALDKLDAFRGGDLNALTLDDALLLVRPPADEAPAPVSSDPIDNESEPTVEPPPSDLHREEIDALLNGRESDLAQIGEALERAWEIFDETGDRLTASAETSTGTINLDRIVDPKLLDWVETFCRSDRFGGLIETDVLDLRQAVERYAEAEPLFVDPEDIWRHDGATYTLEELLGGWDEHVAAGERSLKVVWNEFRTQRAALAAHVRPLLIHPREWLDTHPALKIECTNYLTLAKELFGQVSAHFSEVANGSPAWARATLDALLSLDLLQVRIRGDGKESAKIVMLPLHPLHLWRHQRMGDMLRNLTSGRPLTDGEKAAVIEELQRPETFLSVVRAGLTPSGKGLDRLLPVANHLDGLATFENLHNAVSSADGVETLVQAVDHYVLLYPNHPKPLRLALINPPEPAVLIDRLIKLLDERRFSADSLPRIEIDIYATAGHADRLISAAILEGTSQDLIYEKVAAGRLEIRVAPTPAMDLPTLVDGGFDGRVFHVMALFDESSIEIRKTKMEGLLPMSPFCVRNEVHVDRLLGAISLKPQPGEPPFSDYVHLIHALQGDHQDNTIYASADADKLRGIVDQLVLGQTPRTRWLFLADRALPREAGMRSVRLLERKDGKRRALLAAGDYERLATLMQSAFQTCNLPVGSIALREILRQGANLVGGGLLDLVKKQSGQTDTAKVLGFVGMLLAARAARRADPDCLIASIDSQIARTWLGLGPRRVGERCDLIMLRRDADGAFRFTFLEVKTTLDPNLPEEEERIERAANQIAATTEVIESALSASDVFSAPRLEMLKEVLVRAASNRWGLDEEDAKDRRRWGPWLKDLFNDDASKPTIHVDGEIVVVKLRSNEPPRSGPLKGRSTIRLSTITEPLAEELLGIDPDDPPPSGPFEGPTPPISPPDDRGPASGRLEAPQQVPEMSRVADPAPRQSPAHSVSPRRVADAKDANASISGPWPPALNDLGMIGQYEATRELANLAEKSRGWGERFPDKLLEGPAGVGKSTIARRIGEKLLHLEPILFNGADLRRPEMIIERLTEIGRVPSSVTSGVVEVEPCLVFIDEVHAISKTVATALLSALDDRRTTTVGNVVYSFENVVFLLATTDPGQLSEAFLSRPTRTLLSSYSLEEAAGIVWLHAKSQLGAEVSRESCIEIAARMQCNPRPSVNILTPLAAAFYQIAKNELGIERPSKKDVAELMTPDRVMLWFEKTQRIDANGLTPLHRDYLSVLKNRHAASEEDLRRALGISNKADFVVISEYLTRLGLIRVGAGGRLLTAEGKRYVESDAPADLRARIPRRIS